MPPYSESISLSLFKCCSAAYNLNAILSDSKTVVPDFDCTLLFLGEVKLLKIYFVNDETLYLIPLNFNLKCVGIINASSPAREKMLI